jgi:uncharacterized membrane protein
MILSLTRQGRLGGSRMDDNGLVLLGLLAAIGLLLGPIGFFMALGARSRLKRVEAQLTLLLGQESQLQAALSESSPSSESADEAPEAPAAKIADAAIAPSLVPLSAATREEIAAQPVASADEALKPAPEAPADNPAPKRKVGIEEKLGAHWAVIVGGVALAFGALLLVKYSIDQGFFGPGLRVASGLLLGAVLVAAGEVLRRKEAPGGESAQPAPIPSVLTGAGTVAAFGSLYAAHALYGFIGPGAAALAGLGLIGALGAPLLVNSSEPNPWPVVLYVGLVCAAAYGLARLRRWLWLAIAAAIGAAIWQALLVSESSGINRVDFEPASLAHLVAETALAIAAFALAPNLAIPPGEQRTDRIASAAMLGAAALASVSLAATSLQSGAGPAWSASAALVAAMLAMTGVRLPAVASAAAGAGLVVLATLASWGANARLIAEPYSFFADWPATQSMGLFVGFGLVASLALGALCLWRLLDPTPLSFAKSAIYAGAGVLTPLGALSLLYLRLANLSASAPLAATAAAIAAAMAVGAAVFLRRRTLDASPAIALGLGALAAGTIAALALGLVFVLSEGSLTVALALAALGSAIVADRLAIPALRWCVLGLGLAVAGRFVYEPRIVGDALGKTIILNWLLFGYGIPALAFGLAARLMRRAGEDAPMRVAQALSILCAALLSVFEIRHALNDGDPFARSSGLIEQGLMTVVGIMFSLVLMELNARRADSLVRWASIGFGALALAQGVAGLLLWENPVFSGAPVEGGAIFNGLLLGYALPALAAFVLARRSFGRPPAWRRNAAIAAGVMLLFAYLNLELRRLFQASPSISLGAATGDGEFYAYSALWLATGILLLGYGIMVGSKPARLASAALVSLTVVKVFLFDLAGLEGVLRALSFLGLGAALIGIGLVYQKFVFGARSAPPPAASA